MAFIPIPNSVLAELRYTQDDQSVENTLWFEATEGVTINSIGVLGQYLMSWWLNSLRPFIGQDVQLREIYITDMTSQTGFSATIVPTTPQFGGSSTDATTNSNTVCVSFRTNQRGRSFRGRNYVVGLPANALTQNTVSAAYRNGIQSAYAELLTMSTAVPWLWVVVSKFTNGAERTTGVTTQVQSVVVVDAIVDNQRRRLPGRGR